MVARYLAFKCVFDNCEQADGRSDAAKFLAGLLYYQISFGGLYRLV
jgi:hypothetical protein